MTTPSLTDLQALLRGPMPVYAIKDAVSVQYDMGVVRERFVKAADAIDALIARVAELERDLRELAEDFSEGVQRAVQARLAIVERETVEKCAKVAEQNADAWQLVQVLYIPEREALYRKGATDAAVSIRALAPPVTTKEQP